MPGVAVADGVVPDSGPPPGTKALALTDVVKLALKNNETVRIAADKIENAEGAVQSAVGAFLPTVTLGGTAATDARENALKHYYSGTSTFTVKQPVLHPSAIPLYRAARYNLDAAKFGAGEDDRTLSFQAAKAFTTVVAAERVVVAAQDRLDRAKAGFDATQALVDSKINSSNDATRAKLDVSTAVRNLAQAKNSAETARIAMYFIMGVDDSDPVAPPNDVLTAAEAYKAEPLVLSKSAATERNDLKEAHAQTLAAKETADEPNWRLAPQIDLQGQVTANPDPGTKPWDNETLQLSLTWTIFDGGVRYGDRRARLALADEADQTEKKLGRSVTKDVETAYAALASAQAALKAAQDAVDAAQLNTDETLTLYNQHLATELELTDSNGARFDADVGLAQAQLDLVNAYLDLLAALGRGPLDNAGASR